MKKIFLFCLFGVLFCLNDAFCDLFIPKVYKKVSDAAAAEWGNPYINMTYIQDANREPYGFRIKQGWACCTSIPWSQRAQIPGEERTEDRLVTVKDDLAIIAFVARRIFLHGGEFCLTQLAASSGDRPGSFNVTVQQPNWPGMPCVTLCEPGWDGSKCETQYGEGKTGLDTPCDTTDILAYINAVKQRGPYQGNDSIIFHGERQTVGDDIEFLARAHLSNYYEHIVFLGATDFKTHGIVAQPMLVGIVGNHPLTTSITSGAALSGKVKTLCAQGFTKNDKCEVSSKNCGSNVWCNGYSASNFKSDVHTKQMKNSCNIILCKDRSKALDSNFNCVDYDNARKGLCEIVDNVSYGKLVECGEGYVFEASTCSCNRASSVISKDLMQYGPRGRNTETINEQCWTKESSEDFKDCVLGAR